MTSERPIVWGAAAAVVAAAIAFYYYYDYGRRPVQMPATPAATASEKPAPAPAAPAIEHPVPQSQAAVSQPLPQLDASDADASTALEKLPGASALAKFLIPKSLVRHIVATIDNLPRRRVAVDIRPVQPTPGGFAVTGTPGHLTISPDNAARYTPFVDLVKAVNAKQLVAVYFHFYPLFQQAYEDLGYPTEYFNDRVIAVIDHLLAAPDIQGPIEVVQPNVEYQYADPKLEALSAGQKTLIRMGPANEAVIKAKLREIRQLIATQPPGSAAVAAPASGTAAAPGSGSSAPGGASAAASGSGASAPSPRPPAAPAPASPSAPR